MNPILLVLPASNDPPAPNGFGAICFFASIFLGLPLLYIAAVFRRRQHIAKLKQANNKGDANSP